MFPKNQYISKIEIVVPINPSESLMYQCFQGFPYLAHLFTYLNPVFCAYLSMLLICESLGMLVSTLGDRRGNPPGPGAVHRCQPVVVHFGLKKVLGRRKVSGKKRGVKGDD